MTHTIDRNAFEILSRPDDAPFSESDHLFRIIMAEIEDLGRRVTDLEDRPAPPAIVPKPRP